MLSGYPHPLYDDWAAKHGFRCESFSVPNNASAAKTKQRKEEVIWMNYPAPSCKKGLF